MQSADKSENENPTESGKRVGQAGQPIWFFRNLFAPFWKFLIKGHSEYEASFLFPKQIGYLTVASFFVFQKTRGCFSGFLTRRWSQTLTRPCKSPPDGGSFGPINFFSKTFFIRSLTGSEPDIHRFDQPTEAIWLKATSAYYLFLLRISG